MAQGFPFDPAASPFAGTRCEGLGRLSPAGAGAEPLSKPESAGSGLCKAGVGPSDLAERVSAKPRGGGIRASGDHARPSPLSTTVQGNDAKHVNG